MLTIARETLNSKVLNSTMHRHNIRSLSNIATLTGTQRHAIMQVIRTNPALIGRGRLFKSEAEAKSADGWRKLETAIMNGEVAIKTTRKTKKSQAPAIAKEPTCSTEERLAKLCDLLVAGKISDDQFVAMSKALAIK